MQRDNEKRSHKAQEEQQQPGDMSSFNQKDIERSTDVEDAEKAGIEKKENDMEGRPNRGESSPSKSK